MQPIERVGVFALLFLVVTVVAVVLWDRQPEDLVTEVAAAERAASTAGAREKGKNKTPQLGSTTVVSRNERSTASGRPSTDSRRAGENGADRSSERGDSPVRLPVSEPARELTPAPKPSRSSTPKTGRHEPSNRPAAGKPSADKAVALRQKDAESPRKAVDSARTAVLDGAVASSTPVADSYTVRAGDTLSEISLRQLGTSKRWKEIAQLNGVNAESLAVGMKLRLPGGVLVATDAAPDKRAVEPKRKEAESAAGERYRVQDGDSLWLIAAHQLGSGSRWAEIAKLNPSIDPDKLVVGTSLVLPAGAAPRARAVVAKNTTPARSQGSARPRVR